MNVEYVARNCTIDPRLRELAEEKLEKLRRFLDEPIDVQAVFEVERHQLVAELKVSHRHGNLVATEAADDARAAFTLAVEKAEKQARRERKRFQQNRRRAQRNHAQDEAWAIDVVEAGSVGGDGEPVIIESRTIPVKPMSIEEALLQLETAEEGFVVYRDGDNGHVSVLYRRRDGNLGLVLPRVAG